jgi:putative oxidoreductase
MKTFILKILSFLNAMVWLPLLGIRLWIANVFWQSGMVKLDDWQGTVALFADEYRVPLLPPELAAYMGTAAELTAPVLIILGLGTRLGALALLIMTAVIEFTYMHFDVHEVWALMLLLLLCTGAGRISIDYYIRKGYTKA